MTMTSAFGPVKKISISYKLHFANLPPLPWGVVNLPLFMGNHTSKWSGFNNAHTYTKEILDGYITINGLDFIQACSKYANQQPVIWYHALEIVKQVYSSNEVNSCISAAGLRVILVAGSPVFAY